MDAELRKALDALRAVVENKGPPPNTTRARLTEYHWPLLMQAVRDVLRADR